MFIQPMLLTTSDTIMDGSQWFFEPKLDGHRLIVSHINSHLNLYTRHGNEVTLRYPELHTIPFNKDCILDGELICLNGDKEDFDLLMKRFHTHDPERIKHYMYTYPVQFVVFDLLYYNGKDLRHLPLYERKNILDQVFEENRYYRKIITVEEYGEELYKQIVMRGMEGIVCKDKESRYVSKRSTSWLKVINWKYADVTITGYRKSEFGWLCKDLAGNASGMIEYGPSPLEKQAFYKISRQLVTHETDQYVFVEPVIKAKIKYRMLTSNNRYRIPVFIKFLTEKAS